MRHLLWGQGRARSIGEQPVGNQHEEASPQDREAADKEELREQYHRDDSRV